MPLQLEPIPFLSVLSPNPPEEPNTRLVPQQISPIPLISASTVMPESSPKPSLIKTSPGSTPHGEDNSNGGDSSPQDRPASSPSSLVQSSLSSIPSLLSSPQESPTANAVLSYLGKDLTTNGSLDDPNTAQNWAYRELMDIRSDWNIKTDEIEITQTYVLLVLYSSTKGNNWTISTGWTPSSSKRSSVCGDKNQDIPWYGVVCPDNQVITEIVLNDNNLVGTLPSEIQGLSALTNLTLSNNIIFGVIPSSIGSLTDLGKTFIKLWIFLVNMFISASYLKLFFSDEN
jgi:hypothetical protein